MTTNGIASWNNLETTWNLELGVCNETHYVVCLAMLFFKMWKVWPHMSISLWVKRSNKNLVLAADNVVRFVTGYKLWSIIWANTISGVNLSVFMDCFVGVPPSICIISLIAPILSSYCVVIGCEGGQTSRKSWISCLVITNSFYLTQQLISFPSTVAFDKNSHMISSYTVPLGFRSFVHVPSLNTSGMKVS